MKYEITANRIREAMSDADITQQELADKSQIGKSSISHYVNGTNEPANKSAYAMAKVLHVNPAWLMGLDAPKHMSREISYIISDSRHDQGLPPVVELKEEIEIALELYEKYKCAIPQVREAVDALLKPEYIEKHERKGGKS